MVARTATGMSAVVLTVKEAAARLGVGTALVYELVADGRLRACRVGNGRGRIRIPVEAVGEYLEQSTITPPATASPSPRRRPRPADDPWSGRLRF
jgi:excisionase family DNA binding protein